MQAAKTIRIGGGSAFWGDSVMGPVQLVRDGALHYLVLEYLAELTMSLLVRAHAKDPELGYATDFVNEAMRLTLKDALAQGVRIVTNAGGVNPAGCARALSRLAAELGVTVRIAVVEGDDVLPQIEHLRSATRELSSGAPLPAVVSSANAYLGAFPIARALAAGADVVIVGRCVDSALVLGPLVHEFGWAEHDYDRLAAGSVAGHLLECSTQASGGVHTDWKQVADWANIGFPIAECHADGSFVLTKPAGTGGLVNRLTVGEQLIYEIHDPANYLLPDVTVDFTQVRLTEVGPDRVLVDGARGRAPSGMLKVTATHADGWRVIATRTIVGADAVAKAERLSDELIRRCNASNAGRGLAPFSEVCSEVLGSEKSSFGPYARGLAAREVVLRVAVKHQDRRALKTFINEVASFGTGGPPGVSGSGGGRSTPQPVLRLYSFLLPRDALRPMVTCADAAPIAVPFVALPLGERAAPAECGVTGDAEPVSPGTILRDLAVGRSGDKGDTSNIALIARDPAQLAVLWQRVTPDWVRQHLGHLVQGSIRRYALPGCGAMNLVLEEALGGGGMASLRNDPLGKTLAHILLEAQVA